MRERAEAEAFAGNLLVPVHAVLKCGEVEERVDLSEFEILERALSALLKHRTYLEIVVSNSCRLLTVKQTTQASDEPLPPPIPPLSLLDTRITVSSL